MTLASEARNAVSLFLGETCTQEYFANLLGVPAEKVKAWEQGELVQKGTTHSLWLRLLVQHTEFMVSVLTAFRVESQLGITIPFAVAVEIVHVLVKPNPSRVQLSKRACSVLARSACRAERLQVK